MPRDMNALKKIIYSTENLLFDFELFIGGLGQLVYLTIFSLLSNPGTFLPSGWIIKPQYTSFEIK
jgi:hypothetical protein